MSKQQASPVLVVCEKPDAARRVSEALSSGSIEAERIGRVSAFRFRSGSTDYVVCSAQGHLYEVSDPFAERSVYPVFDVEWFPSSRSAGNISLLRKLAKGASTFVNACDFDVEGETIGFNVLRYACSDKERTARRAIYSTLVKEDLRSAFEHTRDSMESRARAGRARHLIDFLWGVNFSRILSRAALRRETVSVGRVQGPTLGFLASKELEVSSFVPVPFWTVLGTFERGGKEFGALSSVTRFESRAQAERVKVECEGGQGVVIRVERNVVDVSPQPPFNVSELQHEAFRELGFSPSLTLKIAESLYLKALISYPRTDSQKLPASIDLRAILRRLGSISNYAAASVELMKGPVKPVQGWKVDFAHPAIHPTGETPPRLRADEAAVFDLIVRRFLSSLGPCAKREVSSVTIAVGVHDFRVTGVKTLSAGWMKYSRLPRSGEKDIPLFNQGDRLRNVGVKIAEGFTGRPPRYNQSTLLEKMEEERVGTKSTRAEILSTLYSRGYVKGGTIEVSELGLTVDEVLKAYAPLIATTELTRDIEVGLELIEQGKRSEKSLLRDSVRTIATQLLELESDSEEIERKMEAALGGSGEGVIGKCPTCKTGWLRLVRSKKTRKRFVGCSNYRSGCEASAPLLQRGKVLATGRVCVLCSWPVISVTYKGNVRTDCVNASCPGKGVQE